MTDGQSPPDLQSLFDTAQHVQQQLSKIQEELAGKTVEGSSGGGLVRAVANGRQQLVSLRIDPEVVDREEVGMLEDLVLAAVNQAMAKATELAQQEMARLTGQMNIKLHGLF